LKPDAEPLLLVAPGAAGLPTRDQQQNGSKESGCSAKRHGRLLGGGRFKNSGNERAFRRLRISIPDRKGHGLHPLELDGGTIGKQREALMRAR
jgi:hypothetical protein